MGDAQKAGKHRQLLSILLTVLTVAGLSLMLRHMIKTITGPITTAVQVAQRLGV